MAKQLKWRLELEQRSIKHRFIADMDKLAGLGALTIKELHRRGPESAGGDAANLKGKGFVRDVAKAKEEMHTTPTVGTNGTSRDQTHRPRKDPN